MGLLLLIQHQILKEVPVFDQNVYKSYIQSDMGSLGEISDPQISKQQREFGSRSVWSGSMLLMTVYTDEWLVGRWLWLKEKPRHITNFKSLFKQKSIWVG